MGTVVRNILPSTKTVKKPMPPNHRPNPSTLGQRVRNRRLERGLSQLEAAALIGVTEESLSNWEREAAQPRLRHYPGIIAFLGYYPFEHELESVRGRLTYLRNSRGYSYASIGRALGVDATTARAWVLRGSDPLIETIIETLSRL